MGLPDNISFLPGAAEEFLRLRRERHQAYTRVLSALISLVKDGPPEATRYVPIQELPFPNALAYRFEAAGCTIVFECGQRVVMKTASGLQVARALRSAGERRYVIWAILGPGEASRAS